MTAALSFLLGSSCISLSTLVLRPELSHCASRVLCDSSLGELDFVAELAQLIIGADCLHNVSGPDLLLLGLSAVLTGLVKYLFNNVLESASHEDTRQLTASRRNALLSQETGHSCGREDDACPFLSSGSLLSGFSSSCSFSFACHS